MKTISSCLLRYVCPIRFQESVDRATPKIERYKKPNGNKEWCYERQSAETAAPDVLYPYVGDIYFADIGDRAGVGRLWKMQKADGKAHLQTRFVAGEDCELTVSVDEIGLLLTRNEVGFLWLEIGLSGDTLTEELLKEFEQQFLEADPFREWILEWISPLEAECIRKSLLLYAEIAEEEEKDNTQLVCEAGEAGVRIHCFGKNRQSDRETRFFLYLKALHMKYAMLRFQERIRRNISGTPGDYRPLTEKDPEKRAQKEKRREAMMTEMTELSTLINVFLLKNCIGDVGFSDEVNRFYDFLLDRLKVPQDRKALEHAIRNLDACHDRLLQVLAEESAEKQQLLEKEAREREAAEDDGPRGNSFFDRIMGKS